VAGLAPAVQQMPDLPGGAQERSEELNIVELDGQIVPGDALGEIGLGPGRGLDRAAVTHRMFEGCEIRGLGEASSTGSGHGLAKRGARECSR